MSPTKTKKKAPPVDEDADLFDDISEGIEVVGESTALEVKAPMAPANLNNEQQFMYMLATDPNVDMQKMKEAVDMMERAQAREAKKAFTEAFAAMQGELPEIKKLGVNKGLSSSYAKFEHIQRAIRPVLQKHGFALNFFNEPSEGVSVAVKTRLSHIAGHYEETVYTIANPGDLKNKGVNSVQAGGSANSYAKRYGMCALLNIVTADEDDDGYGVEAPEPPEGYESWAADMWSVADEGAKKFGAAFKKADKEFREYGLKWERGRWEDMKKRAREVEA